METFSFRLIHAVFYTIRESCLVRWGVLVARARTKGEPSPLIPAPARTVSPRYKIKGWHARAQGDDDDEARGSRRDRERFCGTEAREKLRKEKRDLKGESEWERRGCLRHRGERWLSESVKRASSFINFEGPWIKV